MTASTARRVEQNTSEDVNRRIQDETERRIAGLTLAGREAITDRLRELEREWDVERALQAHAAGAILASMFLGATVSRKFGLLPGLVGGFLMQHAIQGWCPPLAMFRRMGVRTAREIEAERHALKALRGDYQNLPDPANDVPYAVHRSIAAAARR